MRSLVFPFSIALLLFSFFSSCSSDSKEESDMKLNEFHNDLVSASNSYKILPSDSTKKLLFNLLDKYPNDVHLNLLLARVNYDIYEDDSSLYYYYLVSKFDSNNIHALNGLSSLYSLKNNKDSAYYYINKSTAINDSFALSIINKQYNNLYFSENLDTNSLTNLKLYKVDSTASVYLRMLYILKKINKNELSEQYLNLFFNTGFKDSLSVDLLINDKSKMDSFFRKYKL